MGQWIQDGSFRGGPYLQILVHPWSLRENAIHPSGGELSDGCSGASRAKSSGSHLNRHYAMRIAVGSLRALECLRDMEALRLAMTVSGATEERRRLLHRILDEPPNKRPHRDAHTDDRCVREALANVSPPSGGWCVTAVVLAHMDTRRRADAPPMAERVARRLVDSFFDQRIAQPGFGFGAEFCAGRARGSVDELSLEDVPGWRIRALCCTLMGAPPWSHALRLRRSAMVSLPPPWWMHWHGGRSDAKRTRAR